MAKPKTEETAKATRKPAKIQSSTKVALCVPSSVISKSNARNLEQITNIAYQIAKAASVYNVSEIVVLDIPTADEIQKKLEAEANKAVQLEGDKGNKKIKFNISNEEIVAGAKSEEGPAAEKLVEKEENENNALLLATLLQFFVTPPYLVKGVFRASKYNKKFKYAEKLPKLSNLPFMNNNGVIEDFKEGLTVPKHTPKIQKKNKKVSALKKLKVTKYVNVGQSSLLELNGTEAPVNVRVTVDVKNKKIVSPQEAYGVTGSKASFGYFVRYAKSFSSIFTELSFPSGYTESVFVQADDFFGKAKDSKLDTVDKVGKGEVLFVVSNLKDLEYSFSQEKIPGVEQVTEMFDSQVKVPPGLRIEDAALVALAKAL